MDLKDIVSIAGIGGLHKIIGRTKAGLILETLNDTKKRFATGMQDKVSVLDDISMYTMDGDMRLAEVLVKLNERGDVPSQKDDAKVQRNFLIETINLDSERVYDSDIKKLLTWFHGLKTVIDFTTLVEAPAAEDAEEKPKAKKAKKEDVAETEAMAEEKPKAKKVAAPKTPKTSTPKTSAPKANTKGVAGSKNTYRPKSV